MRQPGEPAVEDLLESIKKVIARDNQVTGQAGARAGGAEQRRLGSSAGLAAAHDLRGLAQAAPATAFADDVLDLAMSAQFLDDHHEDDMHNYGHDNHGHDDGDEEDKALIAPEARASMRESLAALAMLAQPGKAPQIVRSGETSLEELTRELLRPALAQWLDEHLPALVESMVAAEIARIVGKKA
ncbi:MAG TPA: DUF2497 domain-containing protein [Novosphingobium sp.]|nr:DUF2497 domain-containing protein [Novosphingobium sp.]